MPRTHTMQEIAAATGGRLVGDGARAISRITHPSDWRAAGDLALAMDKKLVPLAREKGCDAVVLGEEALGEDVAAVAGEFAACVVVRRPRLAMAQLTGLFAAPTPGAPGVHPTATVEDGVQLGAQASVGAHCYVASGAQIGDRAVLHAHVTVEAGAQIGADTLVRAGVRIGENVSIGARCIIHYNAVIGADGFSFVTPEAGSVESAKASGEVKATNHQGLVRIASLGNVIVGDDVEIGACTSIDRGTVAPTRIGRGTKIDNQVQIGHNVQIGEDCLICGRAGIAGSAVLGNRVVLGGSAGVGDHLRIGDDAVVQAFSGVGSTVPAKSIVAGLPAMARTRVYENIMHINRLKMLFADVKELAQKLARLEQSRDNG
ncbi:MAG: UDP-3-O-(3-hydroxymyristoyl)glucosamine N-acyltransferase [Alphaproteobacteria bacterium]|nr:UDP-3-O-(3-hydroxymyristoyl)glucosamine N-acyltransferase [Alphaproteobacteria bacterium]